jgi:hypothetical protein
MCCSWLAPMRLAPFSYFWTCWNGAELGRAAPPLDLSVNHSVDEGAGRWNRGHRAA